jgi:hypothetical protein
MLIESLIRVGTDGRDERAWLCDGQESMCWTDKGSPQLQDGLFKGLIGN